MSEGKTMGERVVALEQWSDGHEQRCDDRQVAMGREIRELKDSVASLAKGAWGVAGAIILQLLTAVAFLLGKALHLI